MEERIKVADLPDFDAAPYLDSEIAVAAYLSDILKANDAALLAAALGDIARARGMQIEPLNKVEYGLDELIRGITTKNLHAEIGFGKAVGQEALE